MTWETQGRQYHQWFGHGTAGHPQGGGVGRDDPPRDLAARAQAVAHGVIGALPARLRGRMTSLEDGEASARQVRVLAGWGRAATLGRAKFADKLLDRNEGDLIAAAAWRVAKGVAGAGHAALREGSEGFADLVERIEPDRLNRFLIDAEERIHLTSVVSARPASFTVQVGKSAAGAVRLAQGPILEPPIGEGFPLEPPKIEEPPVENAPLPEKPVENSPLRLDPDKGLESLQRSFGGNKSDQKWQSQLDKRGWTFKQIDDAVKEGAKYSAPNNINPANGATRYVHPKTKKSVVLDNKTGEILHVGGDGFKY